MVGATAMIALGMELRDAANPATKAPSLNPSSATRATPVRCNRNCIAALTSCDQASNWSEPGGKILGVAGARVVETQHRDTDARRGLGKCAHALVRAQRLVTEGIANDQAEGAGHACGRPMQPAEKLALAGCKIERFLDTTRGGDAAGVECSYWVSDHVGAVGTGARGQQTRRSRGAKKPPVQSSLTECPRRAA